MSRNMWNKWLKSSSRLFGRRVRRQASVSRFRPRVESLEDRCLLAATITVTSTAPFDSGDVLTLLQAIGVNNGTLPLTALTPAEQGLVSGDPTGGGNTIAFDIGGGGKQTIVVPAGLPPIDVSATIDGSTQPGFAGTPLVQLVPGAAVTGSAATFGLDITTDGCTIKDLAIGGFSTAGINLASNGNIVAGNFIGTDLSGKKALANGAGVLITGSNNTIGGLTDAQRNIISGNDTGVFMDGSEILTKQNIVEHNYIGTDVSGTVTLANLVGVDILDAPSNTIGGLSGAATRNIITGNSVMGVNLEASSNVVVGNYIGTDKDGTGKVVDPITMKAGNTVGVSISGVSNTIGGVTAEARNVISGNGLGVQINGTGANLVQGNYIGTDQSGMMGLGNDSGVAIVFASGSTIGGTTPGAGNILSGNTHFGVIIVQFSTGNSVQGNRIGTNYLGTAPVPNGDGGVLIALGSSFNFIGGAVAGAGNVIAGNGKVGVLVTDAQTSFNGIGGNTIGGAGLLANGGDGVLLAAGCSFNDVGGSVAGDGNVISGNTGVGVHITGPATIGNQVGANLIGTNATGTVSLPNFDGIGIDGGANNNTIGGYTPVGLIGNLISGNLHEGIRIVGNGTTANVFLHNFIGTDGDGKTAVPNLDNGILISDAPGNKIGDNTKSEVFFLAEGNLISGNTHDGIVISGANASGNLVQSNYIGMNLDGDDKIPNGDNGVRIDGAPRNVLGQDPSAAIGHFRNLITGNGANGVYIKGMTADGNVISANYIGTRYGGETRLPSLIGNGGDGVRIDGAPNTFFSDIGSDPGIVISANHDNGIEILNGAQGTKVTKCAIGTDLQRNIALPNGIDGIRIDNSTNSLLKGNEISGNTVQGVHILGAAATGNSVVSNNIGYHPQAMAPLPNGQDGILIERGASQNTLGGATAGAGNEISGNGTNGVEIDGLTTDQNVVQGNTIGVDTTFFVAVPNGNDGVRIGGGAANNTIGGAAAGNVIAGNTQNGVEIAGSNSNAVEANRIGNVVGRAGILNVPNGNDGLLVNNGAAQNQIGAVGDGLNNTISGNTKNGVEISGAGTNGNRVQNNFIGTDANGDDGLGNGKDGVLIMGGASNNSVGGGVAGAGNVISANDVNGVEITGARTNGNAVQNNFIGTNLQGVQGRIPLRNRKDGVLISGGAAKNTIGGGGVGGPNPNVGGRIFNPMLSNLISDNGANGVEITDAGTTANVVLQDVIGTDLTGTVPLGNGVLGGGDGVLIRGGASTNTIGGPLPPAGASPGFANLISSNSGDGIRIIDPQSTGNSVFDNFIGTDGGGLARLPNTLDGVLISNAPNNFIGVPLAAANIISGNTNNGVEIRGAAAAGNLVEFNSIGIAFNAAALGNSGCGVYVNGALGNSISNNTIAFNGTRGALPPTGGVIIVDDPATPAVHATSNKIGANRIFLNTGLGIDLGDDGVTLNDAAGHVGPNNFQNFPLLTSAIFDGVNTTVTGSLQSSAPGPFTIEFFSNTVKDPSGYGQGETPLGVLAKTTDLLGHTSFSFTVVGSFLGQFITATATDLNNNTSEFSGATIVGLQSVADVALTNTAAASVAEGGRLTYTITVHNNGPSDAGNVVVTDVLPANVQFVSANFGAATFAVTGATIRVTLRTLAKGATVQGTIVIQVPEEGALANLATVSSTTFDPNLSNNSQTANTTVTDPAVLATPGNVSATAGAPFRGPVATFTDPGGSEVNAGDPAAVLDAHYTVVSINWGDRTPFDTKTGTLSYSSSLGSTTAPFTVTGSHTYAAAGSYMITITIGHEGVLTTVTSPAVVTNLGLFIGPQLTQPISFWAGLLGQELLRRFGLTAGGQTLGQWLATTFPNLYGGMNGASNLSGFTNAQVATYYMGLFSSSAGPKLDAAVLATALDVFATTLSLGGMAGTSYGFLVSVSGLGSYSVNVGFSGLAFGVPNNTVLNVYQILLATNESAMSGEPWGTNRMLRDQLLAVFEWIDGPV
ncbi:MAG TPA: hypothetical protein VKU02_07880 [Gemmataceae bacterium]|nr:hypothetical protein [Gemmataceae bacterium]